jgi:WD40 repeat protein
MAGVENIEPAHPSAQMVSSMAPSLLQFSLLQKRAIKAALYVLCCSLAIGVWYWEWGRSRSLDELESRQIPAKYRFEGQPPELVAVLTTQSAGIGTVGVAFHPDGKHVAAGFGSGEIVIWDVGRLKEIAVLKGHYGPVGALVFSSDGKTLISGSYHGTIRLWGLDSWTPKEQAVLQGHTDWAGSLALSPDGSLLVSGGFDRTIRLWDLRSRPPRERNVLSLSEHVWSVSLASDGQTLAAAVDKTIRLWDVSGDQPREKTTPRQNTESVWRVTFAPDGKMLASCGQDKAVHLWEVDNNRLRYRAKLHGHATSELYGLVFAPDGQTLVSADMDGQVIVWDVDKRLERHRIQLPKDLRHVVFAPDGRHLAISTGRKDIIYILRLPQ